MAYNIPYYLKITSDEKWGNVEILFYTFVFFTLLYLFLFWKQRYAIILVKMEEFALLLMSVPVGQVGKELDVRLTLMNACKKGIHRGKWIHFVPLMLTVSTSRGGISVIVWMGFSLVMLNQENALVSPKNNHENSKTI